MEQEEKTKWEINERDQLVEKVEWSRLIMGIYFLYCFPSRHNPIEDKLHIATAILSFSKAPHSFTYGKHSTNLLNNYINEKVTMTGMQQ